MRTPLPSPGQGPCPGLAPGVCSLKCCSFMVCGEPRERRLDGIRKGLDHQGRLNLRTQQIVQNVCAQAPFSTEQGNELFLWTPMLGQTSWEEEPRGPFALCQGRQSHISEKWLVGKSPNELMLVMSQTSGSFLSSNFGTTRHPLPPNQDKPRAEDPCNCAWSFHYLPLGIPGPAIGKFSAQGKE